MREGGSNNETVRHAGMKAPERSQGSQRESQEGLGRRAQGACSAATQTAPTCPVRPPAQPSHPRLGPLPPAPEEALGAGRRQLCPQTQPGDSGHFETAGWLKGSKTNERGPRSGTVTVSKEH